jgi:hypothetical protein
MLVIDILFSFVIFAPIVLSVPFYDGFDSSLFLEPQGEDLWGETSFFPPTLAEDPSTSVVPGFFDVDTLFPNDIPVDDLLAASPDWTSFAPTEPTEPNNDWLISDNEILSDSGASCPLGKKRDGASCGVSDQPLQPLPPLELPNVFEIQEGSASESNDAARAEVVAQIERSSNPCNVLPFLLQFQVHTCCEGPLGLSTGQTYFSFPVYHSIDNCNLRTNECSCYISALLKPPCFAIPRADGLLSDGMLLALLPMCISNYEACCTNVGYIGPDVSSSTPTLPILIGLGT